MKLNWLRLAAALAVAVVFSGAFQPAARAQGCASPYVVVAGDTLWGISRRCGTTVAALQAANPGLNPSLIRIGQQLNLPGAGPAAAPAPAPPPAPAPSGGGAAPTGLPRLVVANYLPWYDMGLWGQGATSDLPAVQYNSDDDGAIQRHVAQGRQAGLDGFVVHWFQPGDRTDANFQKVLAQSAGQNFFSTVTFLRHILPGATQQAVIDSLHYIQNAYGGHGAALRAGGRLVVFFADMPRVPLGGAGSPVEAWRAIRAQADPNGSMIWIAEGLDPSYLAVFDGLYVYKVDHACCPGTYNKAAAWARSVQAWEARTGRPKYWVGTIMPGWDDTRSVGRPDLRAPSPAFVRDRAGGQYYQRTFDAALGSNPDMLLVHSFNEWIEGSQIEPSVTYGDFYLNLTAQLAARFR